MSVMVIVVALVMVVIMVAVVVEVVMTGETVKLISSPLTGIERVQYLGHRHHLHIIHSFTSTDKYLVPIFRLRMRRVLPTSYSSVSLFFIQL